MAPNYTVESHSSALNNKRLQLIFTEIDGLALAASNSFHFHSITAYYNAVEQIYLNTPGILPDVNIEEIEKIRKVYKMIVAAADENEKIQTKKLLVYLLDMTKQFNFLITSGLQKFEYFFRIGQKQQKGLNKIRFWKDSIFSSEKEKAKAEEEGETGEAEEKV